MYFLTDIYAYTAKFWGFKQTESEFRSFKFTDPSKPAVDTSPSAAASSAVPQLGQIKVTIHEAVVTDGVFDNKCGQFTVPGVAAVAEQSGVKFWMQPSVITLTDLVFVKVTVK